MDKQEETKISKFLSLVLRHSPQTIGIALDENGWVATEELLAKSNQQGTKLSLDVLQTVVRNSDKQRFAFNEDGTRIRASQGHSVPVELGYAPQTPPDLLYHGTAAKNLASIRESGLTKGKRHDVHLSATPETARQVGARHGTPTVLTVHSGRMHADGIAFFRADNGVWLTDSVPPAYLGFSTE